MEDTIDLDFSNMTKEEALQKYINNMKKLEQAAKRSNINGATFKQYVLQQFHYKHSYWTYKCLVYYKICSKFIYRFFRNHKKTFFKFLILCFLLFVLQSYKSEGQAWFIRTIQTFIYPFMRVLRKIAIPLLVIFPQMANLYEETCLVSNPYFQTNQIDCSGCQHINIMDLTSQTHLINVYNNFPFILNMDSEEISLQDIHYRVMKMRESSVAGEALAQTFLTFYNNTNDKQNHTIWKCNTMNCARLLRKVLPRPKKLPKEMSISVTRFLTFDTRDWPAYKIPDGDCDMAFIYQIIGSRKVVLTPNSKCFDVCKKLTINLSEKNILFYNWWFYDAISVPNYQSKLTIAYIGSYC